MEMRLTYCAIDDWDEAAEAARAIYLDRLQDDERRRAASFKNDRSRWRFALARGMARDVLADVLGIGRRSVRFAVSSAGKPHLADRRRPTFSLSYSERLLVVAVHDRGPVGVDVERVISIPEIEAIARTISDPTEAVVFARIRDDTERTEAFYRLWTRKEALLKAIGTGFSIDPRSFIVGAAQAPVTVVESGGDHRGRWRLEDLRAFPGYAGALAYPDGVGSYPALARIRRWRPFRRFGPPG